MQQAEYRITAGSERMELGHMEMLAFERRDPSSVVSGEEKEPGSDVGR